MGYVHQRILPDLLYSYFVLLILSLPDILLALAYLYYSAPKLLLTSCMPYISFLFPSLALLLVLPICLVLYYSQLSLQLLLHLLETGFLPICHCFVLISPSLDCATLSLVSS